MHDTSRVHGHPSRIIISIEGIELKLPFRRLREIKHLTLLEKLRDRFQKPPPLNAQKQVTLETITSRIKYLEEER